MEQYVLKLYNDYINNDSELTFTYLTTVKFVETCICIYWDEPL